MNDQSDRRLGFFSRLLPRIENSDQLHIVLSVVIVVFGASLIVVGAFLPYLGEAPENDVSELKRLFSKSPIDEKVEIDHAFTVMLIGLLLVIVGFQQSFVDSWKKFRGEKVDVNVNLEGLVRRDEIKREALRKS